MAFATRIIALAAGVAAFTASSAQAADYLTYTFNFTGTETHNSNLLTGGGTSRSVQGSIAYYLPTSFAGASGAAIDVSPNSLVRDVIGARATGGTFLFGEAMGGFYPRPSTRAVSISASIAGGIPGPAVSIDPSCSSFSFDDVTSLGIFGGDRTTITGTLTSLAVSEGYGTVRFGLAAAPTISAIPVTTNPTPEPAAWAMMILGMGAVGTALRRRSAAARRGVALA